MSLLECRVVLPLGRFGLDVDFSTTARVTGVFGRSGAGKSSLLEAIIGLRDGARGRVALDGDVWLDAERGVRVAPEKRDVGYVPQSGLLFPHLTVEGNLAVGERRARARGVDVAKLRAQVVSVLALDALLGQPATVLSGGERQRVALGRALCSAPRLLVLDEPLASLDVAMQSRLLPFLRRVRDAFDVPMLFVSHAPLEIATLCDHVIALEDGKIIARGTPSEVLTSRDVLRVSPDGRLRSVFIVEQIDGSRVRVVGTDVVLATRASHVSATSPLTLAIPSDAVILARGAIGETTASNAIPARVTQIAPHGAYAVVSLAIAESVPPLLAEVTDASLVRLGIAVGAEVTAIWKASSATILEASDDVDDAVSAR